MVKPRAFIGNSFPLGAHVRNDGVNFCVFSRDATAMELALFDDPDEEPALVVPLDPVRNCTAHYWHIFVPGLGAGQLYGFRADGPAFRRFDRTKLLLDPYGRGVSVPRGFDREAGAHPGDNSRVAMKSVVIDTTAYDWEDDHPLHRPFAETVIYEMHVGGFTRHPSAGVPLPWRGTYRGLQEKIPYLVDLGITAVELLPIFQFDEQFGMAGLPNYWGYSPVSFFAPHMGYGTSADACAVVDELRDMVKALHRARIEVILDVVYNHTAEWDERGPTMCWRGLADSTYYTLDRKGKYIDYTGTGNTINPNRAVTQRLVVDSLSYWVREMHVDGFRFDLASILARGEDGQPLDNPPLLWAIDSEPALAGAKLIAEAWDAAGLYQVGSFVGERFTEWNGKFRDDVRSFMRGDAGTVHRFAQKLMGSPDVYAHKRREPTHSINFVTCHDGFTLNDLVTYSRKYNLANREDNRDGSEHNLSWNCGVEGPTTDPRVEALRLRQIKNMLVVTVLSLGTPMLLMGDEVRRTQGGNNNAWCQDNEVSWLDWTLLERHAGVHRFVKLLIAFRQLRDIARLDRRESLPDLLGRAVIHWHGVHLGQPDWSWDSHSLAMTVESLTDTYAMHIMINAWRAPLSFELPARRRAPYGSWRLLIDTARPSPQDINDLAHAPELTGKAFRVESHCVVLLLCFTPAILELANGNGKGKA